SRRITTATGTSPAWWRSRPATGAAAGAVLLDGLLQPRGGVPVPQPAAGQRPRALLQVLARRSPEHVVEGDGLQIAAGNEIGQLGIAVGDGGQVGGGGDELLW